MAAKEAKPAAGSTSARKAPAAAKPPEPGLLRSLTYSLGANLFGGANALTPHWAGAVDVVAVRQQDGSLKSSPFYVRFGKYQSLYRWRDRAVIVEVNGHAMPFTMKLGSYGNAYFVREGAALDADGEAGEGLAGRLSPLTLYDSDDATGRGRKNTPRTNAELNREVADSTAAEPAADCFRGDQGEAGGASEGKPGAAPPGSTGGPAPLKTGDSGRTRSRALAWQTSGEMAASPRWAAFEQACQEEAPRRSHSATASPAKEAPVSQSLARGRNRSTPGATGGAQAEVPVAPVLSRPFTHDGDAPDVLDYSSISSSLDASLPNSYPRAPPSPRLRLSHSPSGHTPVTRTRPPFRAAQSLSHVQSTSPPVTLSPATSAASAPVPSSAPPAATACVPGAPVATLRTQDGLPNASAASAASPTPQSPGPLCGQVNAAAPDADAALATLQRQFEAGGAHAAGAAAAVMSACTDAGTTRDPARNTSDISTAATATAVGFGAASASAATSAQQPPTRGSAASACVTVTLAVAAPSGVCAAAPVQVTLTPSASSSALLPAVSLLSQALDSPAAPGGVASAVAAPAHGAASNADPRLAGAAGGASPQLAAASGSPALPGPAVGEQGTCKPRSTGGAAAPESPFSPTARAAARRLQHVESVGESPGDKESAAAVSQQQPAGAGTQAAEDASTDSLGLAFGISAAAGEAPRCSGGGDLSHGDATPSPPPLSPTVSLFDAQVAYAAAAAASAPAGGHPDSPDEGSSAQADVACTAQSRHAVGDAQAARAAATPSAAAQEQSSSGERTVTADARQPSRIHAGSEESARRAAPAGAQAQQSPRRDGAGRADSAAGRADDINANSGRVGGSSGAAGQAAAPQGTHAGAAQTADVLRSFALSACAHLLEACEGPAEVARVFAEHQIAAGAFGDHGRELLASEALAVRVGERVYRYRDAMPFITGLLAFRHSTHWQRLEPEVFFTTTLPKDAEPRARRSWWSFWSKSASDTADAVPGDSAPAHGDSALPAEPATALSDSGALRGAGGSPRDSNARGSDWGQLRHGEVSAQFASGQLTEADASGELPASDEEAELAEDADDAASQRAPTVFKTSQPTTDELAAMMEHLTPGANTISFRIGSQKVQSSLFLWEWNIRVVISDVDGTITRSDVLGHVLPNLGFDWSHPGITRLFSNIASNGYQFVFLSSRSIAQSSITRAFLEALRQDTHQMPSGPVIISPHGIIPSLYREMILKRPQEFKIEALQAIRDLFPPEWNPFFAGFGNRDTDEISYLEVGVSRSRIFTINPKGEVRQETAPVQSATFNSLLKIDDQVDLLFPVTAMARALHTPLRGAAAALITPSSHSSIPTDHPLHNPGASSDAAAATLNYSAAHNSSLLTTSAVAKTLSRGDGGVGGLGGVGGTSTLDVEARDEYNDSHYWRAPLGDLDDEELSALEQAPHHAQLLLEQVPGKPSTSGPAGPVLTKPGATVLDDDMPITSPRHSSGSSTSAPSDNPGSHSGSVGPSRALAQQPTRFMSARNRFSTGLNSISSSAALPNAVSNASASAFDDPGEPWLAYGGSAALGDSPIAVSEADDEMASCSSGSPRRDADGRDEDAGGAADKDAGADDADAESVATGNSSMGRFMSLDTSGGERESATRQAREDACEAPRASDASSGGGHARTGRTHAEDKLGRRDPGRQHHPLQGDEGDGDKSGSGEVVAGDIRIDEEDEDDDEDRYADSDAHFVYSPYSPM